MNITLEKLKKTYTSSEGTVQAVKEVSLKIPSNKIFGIIGKSGAGKSSLVRLISLLETPDEGKVFYDDKRVDNLSKKELILQRRRIGMIFQNFALFSSRTAGENIAYPMEICGTDKKKIASRVDELLEVVGLSDKKNSPISTLSGGQKQRIAIARALANNPDVLFCDEATSALDPQTTKSILSLIRDIQQKMNLTVVMITHQMEVVRDACDYVAVLDDGLVVEEGKVSQIFTHPKSSVTKDFLSHISVSSEEASSSEEFVRWSNDGGIYILRFENTLTGEPILSRLAQELSMDFNIRAGGIQHLNEFDVGTMLVDFYGSDEKINEAISYLEKNGVIVEKEEK
ncbi:MAG: methionine ABC transporter ATP-binding protein [Spirochaetaceae bacterium]|mgnify:CR=1|nr:methionine ABC transporter ATP-binding protein [Spirochaetaceae bacterium]